MEKIDKLKATSSSKEKVRLLKLFLTDDYFKRVVEMAYDETLHYNVNKIPAGHRPGVPDFDHLLSSLRSFARMQGMTHQDKQFLAHLCYDPQWTTLVELICNKDLKCGIAAGLINQAAPNLIKVIPYMRCSNTKKMSKIQYPAIVQNKEDGLFVNVIITEDEISFITRSGGKLIFPQQCNLYKAVKSLQNAESTVFMGELRIAKNDERITNEFGKYLPRKEGNGIINKALAKNIENGISLEEANRIHFICWDVIHLINFWDGLCIIPYQQRFHTLQCYLIDNFEYIHPPKGKLVKTKQEAQDFAIKQIAEGEEGAILKSKDAMWKDGTSPECIKLKSGDLGIDKERECELRVVDFEKGKKGTKFEKCIGSLVCQSHDKLLEVNVGTGLSNDDRFYNFTDTDEQLTKLFDDTYFDKIITVRFNEIIQDKKGSKHRLFLPRFIEIRHDRTVADDLEYIKEL